MIDLVCPHILFFSETGQFISTSLVFKAQLADAQRESGLEVKECNFWGKCSMLLHGLMQVFRCFGIWL